jgi:hypothetical protein
MGKYGNGTFATAAKVMGDDETEEKGTITIIGGRWRLIDSLGQCRRVLGRCQSLLSHEHGRRHLSGIVGRHGFARNRNLGGQLLIWTTEIP